MGYRPSLKDVKMTDASTSSDSYLPSMKDLPTNNNFVAKKIINQINQNDQQQTSSPERPMQMQEEFSNPTQWPGFNNLSKEEQLEKIKFSQLDPANQTGLGGAVPPGTFESNPARMIASVLPTLAMPEVSAGGRFISPIINAMGRVGAGTAGNLSYESPNINNMQQFKDAIKNDIGANSLLEGITMPFRGAAKIAELFNPIKYAENKANIIKNEMTATKATTDAMYKPVNDAYNDFPVTVTPKKYLQSVGIERSDLYPDAKIIYDDFMNRPIFNNLHKLQSKLGKDWARISQHPATAEKAELFNQFRGGLQDKVQNFLSRDTNALNQYNLASDYAKNNYYPYLATPTLRKIANGKIDVQPSTLSRSIQKGIEKTVGKNDKSLIPEGHALRNHLNDLNNAINLGKAAQTVVPTMAGAISGEMIHPGLGGLLGGASGGLGASQIASMASKFGAPSMTGFIQNPLIENLMKNYISPAYYGAGRVGINSLRENK